MGVIRICYDLTNGNKAVIPDRYPLPTLEELASFYADRKVFAKIDLKWGIPAGKSRRAVSLYHSDDNSDWHSEWTPVPFELCSAPSAIEKIAKAAQIL